MAFCYCISFCRSDWQNFIHKLNEGFNFRYLIIICLLSWHAVVADDEREKRLDFLLHGMGKKFFEPVFLEVRALKIICACLA